MKANNKNTDTRLKVDKIVSTAQAETPVHVISRKVLNL